MRLADDPGWRDLRRIPLRPEMSNEYEAVATMVMPWPERILRGI